MTRLTLTNVGQVGRTDPTAKMHATSTPQNVDLSEMLMKDDTNTLQMWDPRKRLKGSLQDPVGQLEMSNIKSGEERSLNSCSPDPLSEPAKSPLSAPLSVESPLPVVLPGDFMALTAVVSPKQVHPAWLAAPRTECSKQTLDYTTVHPASIPCKDNHQSVDDLLASLGNTFSLPEGKEGVHLNDSGVGAELDTAQLADLLSSDIPTTSTPLDTSDSSSDLLGASPDSLSNMAFPSSSADALVVSVSVDTGRTSSVSAAPSAASSVDLREQQEAEEILKLSQLAREQQDTLESRYEALQAKLRKQRLQILVWQTMRQWGRDAGEADPPLPTSSSAILEAATSTMNVLHNGEKTLKRKRFRKPVHEIKKRIKVLRTALDEDATDDDSDQEVQYISPSNLEKQLQRRWDKSKASAGWRWQWLQLRLEQVSRDLEQCTETLESLQAQKAPLRTFVEDAQGGSARANGFVPNSKRKLLHPPQNQRPMANSRLTPSLSAAHPSMIRRRASVYDGGFHPVLSMEQDAPPWLLERATLSRRPKEAAPTTVKISVPHSRRKKKRAMTHPQPDSHTTKGLMSPAVSKLRQTTSAPTSPSTPNKRGRVAPALDIDNVVIPSTLAAKRVVALEVKEIPTPTWREGNNNNNNNNKNTDIGPDTTPDDQGVNDHDFSDTAYARLHKPGEDREHSRFQGFVDNCNGRKRSSSDAASRNDTKQTKKMEDPVRMEEEPTPQVAPYPARKFPLSKKAYDRILAEQQAVEISARTSCYSIVNPVEPSAESSSSPSVATPLKLVLKIQRTVDQ